MAIFLLAWWLGENGNVNVFAGENGDRPLTPKQLLLAKEGKAAIDEAGDPGKQYQPPYTNFLTDCCFPRFVSIFNKAGSGAQHNEIKSDYEDFLEQSQKFVDDNKIQLPKVSGLPDPQELQTPVDKALSLAGQFTQALNQGE